MKSDRIIVLLCSIGLAAVVFVYVGGQQKAVRVRKEIMSQDFSALLAGCRDLLEKRTILSDDWADRDYIYEDAIVLDAAVKPYGAEVPDSIKSLNPKFIAVRKNCVFINMGTAPRNDIIGFATNTAQYGSVKLIDGLWLRTGGP